MITKQFIKRSLRKSHIKHPKEKVVQESYAKARELYAVAKKEHMAPLKYHIKNSDLVYSSVIDHIGIAKGTCFPELVFPNFYRVDQITNGKKITTYRCGITPKVTTKDLKDLVKVVSNNRPVHNNSLIVLSLIGSCTTALCKFIKNVANTGLLPKAVAASLNEDNIITTEKKVRKILPLFIPLRPQSVKIVGSIKLTMSKDHQTATRNDKHYTKMQDMIDMTSPETVFKSIVDIGAYYYAIKDRYNLLLHCRSGKDRTTVCDSILHATFDCLMTKKRVDYDFIKASTRLFFEPGLNIAYFSTGIYGLKIKQLELAHYVMTDKQINTIAR